MGVFVQKLFEWNLDRFVCSSNNLTFRAFQYGTKLYRVTYVTAHAQPETRPGRGSALKDC